MALTIVWTRRAEEGFDRIVEHLKQNWTEREIRNFIRDTYDFLELLKLNPHLLEQSHTKKHIHRGPLTRLTILTYRIKPRKGIIELLNIRSSRQKPLQ
ncbi:MAG: type II toxin-antitoxin system RelE/ParE family toxin [Prolixibacteraceae bacterium]